MIFWIIIGITAIIISIMGHIEAIMEIRSLNADLKFWYKRFDSVQFIAHQRLEHLHEICHDYVLSKYKEQ